MEKSFLTKIFICLSFFAFMPLPTKAQNSPLFERNDTGFTAESIFLHIRDNSDKISEYLDNGANFTGNGECYYFLWNDILDEDLSLFVAISNYYLNVSRHLNGESYPTEVWKPILDNLFLTLAPYTNPPSYSFAELDGDLEKYGIIGKAGGRFVPLGYIVELAEALDNYDSTFGRERRYAEIYLPFCGGDSDLHFEVAMADQSASLFLMDEFNLSYCKSVGLEVFSWSCPGKLFGAGDQGRIGDYAYKAIWPDGQSSCGIRTFWGDFEDGNSVSKVPFAPLKGYCEGI